MIFKFSLEQADFLNKELKLNIGAEKEYEFSKEERQRMLDYCMDVEVYETEEADEKGDEILSERGNIAVELCDYFIIR